MGTGGSRAESVAQQEAPNELAALPSAVQPVRPPSPEFVLFAVRDVFQRFSMPPELVKVVVAEYQGLLLPEPACLVSPWFGILPGKSDETNLPGIAETIGGYPRQWYQKNSSMSCVFWTSEKAPHQVNSVQIFGRNALKIPEPLNKLGFKFTMSYDAIKKMLEDAFCPCKMIREPISDPQYGLLAEFHVAQQYEGKPFLVKFVFQSNRDRQQKGDEQTLNSITFSTDPQIFF